jgi:hypothetical protein
LWIFFELVVFVFVESKFAVAESQCYCSASELACLLLVCRHLGVVTTPYIQKTTKQLYGMQGIANKVGRVWRLEKEKAVAHLLFLGRCFISAGLGPPS